MVRRAYTTGVCANCNARRLLKYARRTMCCRYRRQKAAAELRRALDNTADDAEKPTFCYLLDGIEGQRFCDPAEMEGHKLRNPLQNADRTLCYLAYGDFGEYDGDKGTSDKRWVEYDELLDNIDSTKLERELEKYRKKEKQMAAAAKAKRQSEE